MYSDGRYDTIHHIILDLDNKKFLGYVGTREDSLMAVEGTDLKVVQAQWGGDDGSWDGIVNGPDLGNDEPRWAYQRWKKDIDSNYDEISDLIYGWLDYEPTDDVERELFEALGPRKYTDDAYLGMTPEQRKRERARRRREASRGARAEAAKPVEKPVEAPVEKPAAKEQPAVSKPVDPTREIIERLKKLETDDYQGRGDNYPRSGVADSIRLNGNDLEFEFKNTSTGSASNWVYNFLTRKGFYVDNDYIESYQSGDYGDDWVTTYVGLKGISLTPFSKDRLKEFRVYKWETSYIDYTIIKALTAEEAGKKAVAQGYTMYPKVRIN